MRPTILKKIEETRNKMSRCTGIARLEHSHLYSKMKALRNCVREYGINRSSVAPADSSGGSPDTLVGLLRCLAD